MGEHFVRDVLAAGSQMRHGVGDIGRVPEDYGSDDEVEPGSPELLGFVGAISDPPLLERADRARQLMALFDFCSGRPGIGGVAPGFPASPA